MRDIEKLVRHSRIIGFLSDFNSRMIYFFYRSLTFRILKATGSFLRNALASALPRSRILSYLKTLPSAFGVREVGFFIILVVAFNTALLIFTGKEIDIFSISARIVFLGLGLILILKRR